MEKLKIMFRDRGVWKRKEVSAYQCRSPFEDVVLFVHKTEPDKKTWNVSEQKTGCKVSQDCFTKKMAIADAFMYLSEKSHDVVVQKIKEVIEINKTLLGG